MLKKNKKNKKRGGGNILKKKNNNKGSNIGSCPHVPVVKAGNIGLVDLVSQY